MGSLRTLKSQPLLTLLRHQKPSPPTNPPQQIIQQLLQPTSLFHSFLPPISQRTFSTSTELVSPPITEELVENSLNNLGLAKIRKRIKKEKVKVEKKTKIKNEGKPLDVFFKEAVGLIENPQGDEEEGEEIGLSDKEEDVFSRELRKKLWKIEKEVRSMKGNLKVSTKEKKKETQKVEVKTVKTQNRSLYSMFTSKPDSTKHLDAKENSSMDEKEKTGVDQKEKSGADKKEKSGRSAEEGDEKGCRKTRVVKKLSPEMALLAGRLYEGGYLRKANFMWTKKGFELSYFSTYYAQTFLRFAAEEFANDHQEIAKCLSGDELKRIALFGCPKVERKTAFAAKRLRSYFNIQEDIVCRACILKSSCSAMNHTVGKKAFELKLGDVLRVLTLYALEYASPPLIVPDEIQASVSKLLKEVVSLSKY